jgi:hypothetical protein
MVVPSMALTEIKNELHKDLPTLTAKIFNYHKEFKRRVLKASRYPFVYSYECYSRLKKNHFILTFIAIKRSARDNPLIGVYALYTRPEGVYAIALGLESGRTSIYPPHFFKRYRERIAKDFLASNSDIIKRFFATHWGFAFVVLSEDMEAVYHSFENKIKEDLVSFVCATSAGYCFGELKDNTYIVKTIVSEDMLFESQKEVFSNLRKEFIEKNKELYGI